MAIIINIDVMLAKRKMSVTELAEKVGITMANISVLKNGKAKAIRLSTLEAICKALECQPGDILEYKKYEFRNVNPALRTGVPITRHANVDRKNEHADQKAWEPQLPAPTG